MAPEPDFWLVEEIRRIREEMREHRQNFERIQREDIAVLKERLKSLEVKAAMLAMAVSAVTTAAVSFFFRILGK